MNIWWSTQQKGDHISTNWIVLCSWYQFMENVGIVAISPSNMGINVWSAVQMKVTNPNTEFVLRKSVVRVFIGTIETQDAKNVLLIHFWRIAFNVGKGSFWRMVIVLIYAYFPANMIQSQRVAQSFKKVQKISGQLLSLVLAVGLMKLYQE